MKKKVIFSGLSLLLLILLGGFLWRFSSQTSKVDTDIPALLTKTVKTILVRTNSGSSFPPIKHIFVIVEENHDWSTISQNPDAPFINDTLVKQGAFASNYHNIPTSAGDLHPSELNYIFLESGQVAFSDHTFATDDDPSADNSTSSTQHLVTLLEKSGYTWKSYQEGITGNNCPIHADGDYAPKHNPFLYFQDVSGNPPSEDNAYCQQHVRPLSELLRDLQTGNLPNYIFITPNLQHDMHNGTIAQADTWLSQIVPQITESQTYKKDGALFITWDEGEESNNDPNNPIGMIMLSPFIKPGYTNTTEYSHESLLKTIEEIFHLNPLLGMSGNAQTKDLVTFFKQK